MYMIDISDSYPESYWLGYDAKKFPDPALLKKGKLVNADSFSQVYFESNPKISIENLLAYDYLFSNGPEIVSQKLAEILSAMNEKTVQLMPTKIKHNENLHGGFYIINYLAVKKAFKIEECTCVPIIKSVPNGPKKFTRIVLLDSPERDFIFRAEESIYEVVMTDDLAKKIRDKKIKGIKLVAEKSRY